MAEENKEFFTREKAIDIVELMIKQLDEDNMTDALRDVLTGANSHGIYTAKFALETAVEDMKNIKKIIDSQ